MQNYTPHLIAVGELLNHLTTAVILIDSQLQIHFVNTATEQFFDKSANRLLSHKINNLFTYSSLTTKSLNKVFLNNQSFSDSEVTLAHPKTGELFANITVSPLQINNSTFALIELRHTANQRKISNEVNQAAQQVAARHLVRNLAHEIKNPLGGLRGAAQLLEKQLPNQDLREYTNIIIEQADRLRNLVDRLLGPQQASQKAEHNIHKILETVKKLTSINKPEQIQIVRDYDPSIPELTIDDEQIQQAILNIVKNAIEALGDQGVIKLKTRIAHQVMIESANYRLAAEISVINNGEPIPQELQNTIFYPMVTGKSGGTGLGLSISQTIISQHNGKIECSSKIGCTEFKITLPMRKV